MGRIKWRVDEDVIEFPAPAGLQIECVADGEQYVRFQRVAPCIGLGKSHELFVDFDAADAATWHTLCQAKACHARAGTEFENLIAFARRYRGSEEHGVQPGSKAFIGLAYGHPAVEE